MITAHTILQKAAELLAMPLPHTWACCDYDLGPYCPCCAVAKAKGLLTANMAFDAHDDDLWLASGLIRDVIGADLTVLSQGEALAVVDAALRNCEAMFE